MVAVASNFSAPMKTLVEIFMNVSGHKVVLCFGSTGMLYTQIHNGAPYHMFFAADADRPILLEKEGLIIAGSRMTYAIGRIALWSADKAVIDRDGAVLGSGNLVRLALANPRLAPYGVAAVETLKNMEVYERVKEGIVFGENISQTYQFIYTGNIKFGFVSLSQIVKDGLITSGSYWLVPQNLHSPLKQDAVILGLAKGQPAAAEFLIWIKSEVATKIISSFGYTLP